MELLSTWSEQTAHKVPDTDLDVRWEKERFYFPFVISNTGAAISVAAIPCWRIVRHATKEYRYTGMTQAAAKACAAAKRTQYARTYNSWDYDSANHAFVATSVVARQAEIKARRVAGDLWEVAINVNEQHTGYKIGASAPTDAECATVIGCANWEYDE